MLEENNALTIQPINTSASIEPKLYRLLTTLLPPDQIVGVRAISRRLTGSDDKAAVRAIFHKLEHTNTYPAYKFGGQWAVSLSCVFAKHWSEQRKAFADDDQRALALLYMLLNVALPLYIDALKSTPSPQQLAQLALVSSKAARLIERLLRGQPPAPDEGP
jgi:hypothetical protein